MKSRLSISRRHVSTSKSPYICTACRISPPRRPFTTASARTNPPASAYAHLPSRGLLSLSGPDAIKYLQGVITANISSIIYSTASGFYAGFLNAQGRLLNDVFIYPWTEVQGKYQGEESWVIEVDAQEVERLRKHILRYRIRAKFEVRVLGEEMRVWSVWDEGEKGEGKEWTRHGLVGDANGGIEAREKYLGCADNRAPGMGRRAILPAGKKPEVELEESDESAYRVRRYLKGVPEGQSELIREVALPQESNIDFMGGIDYRKGCYVGQELTIRTYHTGVVRKRILPVMVYSQSEPEPSALQYAPENGYGVETIPSGTSLGRHEKSGRSVGKWIAGVGNIGLGLCRLETMTNVLVQGEAGGYKSGDEFKVEWGEGEKREMVKVKAFVPSWHLTKQ